jgi:Domain of unknown function (DUF4287)
MTPADAISPQVSDEAVNAKTGRSWDEWFTALDEDGAAELSHLEIAAHIADRYRIGSWWSQQITVEYERSRGLREKQQQAESYAARADRTIAAPVDDVYRAWVDASIRSRWLDHRDHAVRRATPKKSLRLAWEDESSVKVGFDEKDARKTEVSVRHERLSDAGKATDLNTFWTERLDALKKMLEDQA